MQMAVEQLDLAGSLCELRVEPSQRRLRLRRMYHRILHLRQLRRELLMFAVQALPPPCRLAALLQQARPRLIPRHKLCDHHLRIIRARRSRHLLERGLIAAHLLDVVVPLRHQD